MNYGFDGFLENWNNGDEVRVVDVADWEGFSRISIVTTFMRIEL